MKPYYQDDHVTLHHGDCLEVLATLPDASVDSVVTDPPYGLANTSPEQVADTIVRWVNGDRDYLPGGSGFMGKAWDAFVPPVAVWDECLRVLKPGGHILSFAGSRTHDLVTLALRLAGFEIRDSIAWLYGSGFPKSLDVSKAIDKQRDDKDESRRVAAFLRDRVREAGMTAADLDAHLGGKHQANNYMRPDLGRTPPWETWLRLREVVGFGDSMDAEVWRLNGRKGKPGEAWGEREVVGAGKSGAASVAYVREAAAEYDVTVPATDAARDWQGWGTALKPAFEPVVVARKPLTGTVAQTVLEHGTGALNIDGCRVEGPKPDTTRGASVNASSMAGPLGGQGRILDDGKGRWPANVLLDDSQAEVLDQQSGESKSPPVGSVANTKGGNTIGTFAHEGRPPSPNGHGDSGGASRFFKVISQTPSDLVFLPVECEAWEQPGDASTRAANTSAGRSTESRYASSPIGGYGSKPTDPSPTATRSTTGTTTPSTTTSETSCASPPSGTTTTTSASASSTDGSPESRSAAASGATPTSHSTPSPSGERAPSTATAESAPRRTAESGSPETATSSTHDDARSEHAASTPDFPTFRYQAKAPTRERPFYTAEDGSRVAHPTTKPLDLMRWLVRLVTPPDGTVLEPFAGSGTTAEACVLEGFQCIAIEREPDYLPLIVSRLSKPMQLGLDFGEAS